MEIKKIVEQDGEYICDIDISVDEWKGILQDETLMSDNYKDVLLKFHAEPEHKSTCKALGDKYGVSPQTFNSLITQFAKAVQKKLNRFEVVRDNGEASYWIIPMQGKNVGEYFEWTLRSELVEAIDKVNLNIMNYEYTQFKKLLEYFVAHLEFLATDDINNRGYIEYIKDIKSFSKSGQGHEGHKIQNQVEDWEMFQNGVICINIMASSNYNNRGCYLNWKGTAINVIALWDNTTVKELKIVKDSYPVSNAKDVLAFSDTELGIHDGKEPNENLKSFFDTFNSLIIESNNNEITTREMEKIEPYINLLNSNYNLILTGAPGTGKTYLAKEIAKQIIGVRNEDELKDCGQYAFVQFHPSYDYTDFVEGLRPVKKEGEEIGFELKDGVFKEFCKRALSAKTFHKVDNFDAAWDDLLTMVRNNLANGELTKIGSWEYSLSSKDSLKYSSVNTPSQYNFTITKQNVYAAYQNKQARPSGAFQKDMIEIVEYMKQYQQLKDFQQGEISSEIDKGKFVIIIDEINRAEISKVFGELFFSIDPGYRGIDGRVTTQYANLQEEDDVFEDGFYVPENVYIIGTMNDIDRSVESMDFAMRRRFAWKEIKAEDRISMWDGKIDKWIPEAKVRINSLNKAIEKTQGLSTAYHIGPAYFLKLMNYTDQENPFESLWNNHLHGVIFEYLRGLPSSEDLIKDLEKAYNKQEDVESN